MYIEKEDSELLQRLVTAMARNSYRRGQNIISIQLFRERENEECENSCHKIYTRLEQEYEAMQTLFNILTKEK